MSLGTSNRDGGKTSESGHLRALAKLVTGDVITGLNAVQRAAGVNMSVDVQVGDAFVRRSDDTYAHSIYNDAVYNQTITTADGSNPRRDIVVAYVDYAVTPITTVSNNTNGVVKIAVINGTPAGSPVDPTDPAIQSAVGAGNPWTKLCRVRVPAGQTSISNSLIDDLRSMTTAKITDANVTTAKLADASVTNAKLSTTAGEPGGAWKAWTPTFTGLTVGAGGTLNCAYTQIGKTVHGRLFWKFGTGSAVSGDVSFTLPVTAKAYPGTANITQIGVTAAFDGSDVILGFVGMQTTTAALLRPANANGVFLGISTYSATVPFTWNTNHELTATFTYEAA